MKRVACALALCLAVTGCGGDDGGGEDITVAAATSLKAAFESYADGFYGGEVRLSLAGSDQLAAQIRAGARPDVFAAADEALPAALEREGLVERPVRFATNRVVVAVPASGGRVRELADLAEPGVKIAVGSPSVPIGAYARRAIAGLPRAQAKRIEDNIASEEPDVAAVIGRVRGGAVDAGVVYVTDVSAAGDLDAIRLPADVEVAYAAAVVRGSEHADQARRFVEGLVDGPGRAALERAGFGRPEGS